MLRLIVRACSVWSGAHISSRLLSSRFRCVIAMTHSSPDNFKRLPYNIKPVNYNLSFVPNLSDFTFDAEASIELQVVERTNAVILNSKNIVVSDAHFNNANAEISYDKSQELVIFTFPNALETGNGHLNLKFRGHLSDDMQGFYRSTYKSPTGEESYILCTQFESIYARRAFPCMDEPDRKATFDISLVAMDNEVALSNMPEVSRTIIPPPAGRPAPVDGHNYVKVQFDRSPYMSTYLVAMVVGNFDHVSAKDVNGVDIRVFTPPGKKSCGEYALEVSVKTLPFYARFFGQKFPLPKCDLVALPDFACGAMENWGLITYRETALLIDHEHTSLMAKQRVAVVVTHELAHMWFGNLVTMEWWTHLWLNEGFATWTECLAVDYCFPDYDIWTLFVSEEYARALRMDELKMSHPIEVEVNSPHEVEEIFDAVSYQKGASLIRMLNDYLGAEVFQAGLQLYIKRHQYSNTVTTDLWRALAEVSGQPVQEIMSTWTKQMGYPVLSVRLLPSADNQSVGLGIRQSRFLADGGKEDVPTYWYIPVTVCRADDSSAILSRALVPPPTAAATPTDAKCEHVIPLSAATADTSVRINPGAVGFFRVCYHPTMLPPILSALSQHQIPERDRLSLLDDHFALARAGQCPLTTVLDLTRAYTGEESFSVWSVLAKGLGHVRVLLQEMAYKAGDEEVVFAELSPEEVGLNNLYTQLAMPVYEKLGFDPKPEDSNNDRLLRPIILNILGRARHPDVISKARQAFDVHYTSVTETPEGQPQENLISPDLRTTIYTLCLRNGGADVFQRLLTLHDKATMHSERVRLLGCLGASASPELIERLFQLTFTDYVRKQDRYHVLLGVTGSAAGRRALWRLVKSRIGSLPEELATLVMLSHVLKGSCADFCNMTRHAEVKAFFDAHPVSCVRAVNQALESVKINSTIVQRDFADASTFLRSLVDTSS
uniref:Aminopeptidase n=1 Tax=Schistocephalus solidus TaxID=70667 RepID=A0A0V0J295_SCHSO